ncbi:MAG: hypothetical protein KIS83_10130 [Rubrivivax sp.]|nr:hypothetical protein [Rubrivivax sp.]
MLSLPIYLHDVAILLREPSARVASATRPPVVASAVTDVAGILEAHERVGHRIPEQRLQRRLRNGLRFLRFDIDSRPVATTWVAGPRGRYIDELNWLLPIGQGEWWVRDVFVDSAWRGKHLFAAIAEALSRLDSDSANRVWSDVDWVNPASMRAHETAGFRVAARVRALDVGGRFRIRSRLPDWSLPVTEIDPASRWIWLRGDRLRRHQELLA